MILRHAGSCWESVTSGGEDLFHKKRAVDGQGDRTEDLLMRLFLLAENYVHEVFERCSSMNSSSGQKQAVLAMEYIRAHYMEQELSLNDICSYLNISTSYFSTIFKGSHRRNVPGISQPHPNGEDQGASGADNLEEL